MKRPALIAVRLFTIEQAEYVSASIIAAISLALGIGGGTAPYPASIDPSKPQQKAPFEGLCFMASLSQDRHQSIARIEPYRKFLSEFCAARSEQ